MTRGADISTFSAFFRRVDLTRRPYLPAIAVTIVLFAEKLPPYCRSHDP